MRKIEKEMISAIRNGEGFTKGNTAVLWNEGREAFYVCLHGNIIARGYRPMRFGACDYRITAVNFCGWNTTTTRSRLRALGVPVKSQKGVPCIKTDEALIVLPENGWTELFG